MLAGYFRRFRSEKRRGGKISINNIETRWFRYDLCFDRSQLDNKYYQIFHFLIKIVEQSASSCRTRAYRVAMGCFSSRRNFLEHQIEIYTTEQLLKVRLDKTHIAWKIHESHFELLSGWSNEMWKLNMKTTFSCRKLSSSFSVCLCKREHHISHHIKW